ncbi:WD repeat-containing protein 27 [Entophlyctis luteolus]|nr:WD repeat-containing protein 27 [Entophlyctis luteolus]
MATTRDTFSIAKAPLDATTALHAIAQDGSFVASVALVRAQHALLVRSCDELAARATQDPVIWIEPELTVAAVALSNVEPCALVAFALSSASATTCGVLLRVYECSRTLENASDWRKVSEVSFGKQQQVTSLSPCLLVFGRPTGTSSPWLAFSQGSSVHVIPNHADPVVTRLEGHRGAVNALQFFLWGSIGDCLISAAEDRSFKGNTGFDVAVLKKRNFLGSSLEFDKLRMSIQFADNLCIPDRFDDATIHMYELATSFRDQKKEVRHIKTVASSKFFPTTQKISLPSARQPEVISSIPKWKQKNKPTEETVGEIERTVSQSCIFVKHFSLQGKHPSSSSLILAATQCQISILDAKSFDILHTSVLNEAGFLEFIGSSNTTPASLSFDILVHERVVDRFQLFSISLNSENSNPTISEHVRDCDVKCKPPTLPESFWSKRISTDICNGAACLSLNGRPRRDIYKTAEESCTSEASLISPAAEEVDEARSSHLSFKCTSDVWPRQIIEMQSSPKIQRRSKGKSMNHPITFRKTVNSSGYTQVPAMKMFQLPKIAVPAKRASFTTATTPLMPNDIFWRDSCLNFATKAATVPFTSFNHAAPVTYVKFSDSGASVAAGCVEKTASVHRIAAGVSKSFHAHQTPVVHVAWATATAAVATDMSDKLLSTSLDGHVCLWDIRHTDPVLSFGREPRGTLAVPAPTATTARHTVTGELGHAQFFFRNRFILAREKAGLVLLRYSLTRRRPAATEIKPGLNTNTVTAAARVPLARPAACFDAANAYPSHLAVVACAAADGALLVVLDMTRAAAACEAPAARAVHTVAVPSYAGWTASDALFLTSSTADSIKLWDLRLLGVTGAARGGAVMQLLGHVNRHAKIQCALSPCGRYVATGSEDNQAYVYDTRTGGVLTRVKNGITDAAYGVDFCPTKNVIAVGSSDGKCNLFRL